uniref:Uncharacterized protein n=1 Tax=viral metagenome TaxID=1070528 RepID=A0A6H1ZYZ7_9ZZZZ
MEKSMVNPEIKSGLAFHCHHDTLVEWVSNYDERVEAIKANKPLEEQELRLRLFKLIPIERLPTELLEARAAYAKARAACAKAYFEGLHRELCPDCPWNGETIFSNKQI